MGYRHWHHKLIEGRVSLSVLNLLNMLKMACEGMQGYFTL